jgi:anti-sigma factor RsiW
MNCAELITRFLADYVAMELPADVLADFEHHLDVCASCVAYLQAYRATIAIAAAAFPSDLPEVPEELVTAVLACIRPR